MSYEDYQLLEEQTKQEALLNVIVADNITNNKFIPSIEKINIEEIFKGKINKNGIVNINITEPLKLIYSLPKKYNNKIIFINFTVNNNEKERSIKINNEIINIRISNNYEKQEKLNFILADQNQEKIIMIFEPGKYSLSDFQTYILDTAELEKSIRNYDKLIVNPIRKREEILNGKISVLKYGYFMFTIPYDKGFTIKVNNKKIEYEKVNDGFIGFPILSGTHNISIGFNAPGKKLGTIMSIIGFCSFLAIVLIERMRKF